MLGAPETQAECVLHCIALSDAVDDPASLRFWLSRFGIAATGFPHDARDYQESSPSTAA
jgi:hypothetical protein